MGDLSGNPVVGMHTWSAFNNAVLSVMEEKKLLILSIR